MLKLSKVTTITLWALMGISVLLLVLYSGTKSITEETFIIWGYILTVGAAGMAILFPLLQAFSNPKGLKSMAIAIGAIGVLLLASYGLASEEIISNVSLEGVEDPAGLMKYAGTCIYMSYLLLGVAVVSVIISEVSKSFK